MARPSMRVVGAVVGVFVLLFLFRSNVVQMYNGQSMSDNARVEQRSGASTEELQTILKAMQAQSVEFQNNMLAAMKTQQRSDMVHEMIAEFKAYMDVVKSDLIASQHQAAAIASSSSNSNSNSNSNTNSNSNSNNNNNIKAIEHKPKANPIAKQEESADTTSVELVTTPVPAPLYKEIMSMVTEFCIDANPMDAGTIVRTWSCHHGAGGPYQQFVVSSNGQIAHKAGYCITVAKETNASIAAAVTLQPCSDKVNAQRWTLVRHGGSFVQLRNEATGRCLVAPSRDDVSEPVFAVACTKRCSQLWSVGQTSAKVVERESQTCETDPVNQIATMAGVECLDTNPLKVGTVALSFNCHRGKGGPYQAYYLTADGMIRHRAGFCLDGTNTSAVTVQRCAKDNPYQHFELHRAVGSTKFAYLRNPEHGLCLRSSRATPQKRTAVALEPCANACAQMWNIAVAEAPISPNPPPMSTSKKTVASVKTPRVKRTKDRIFCFVLTHPREHSTRARAINNTWGRECTYLIFITSQMDPDLPTVVANLSMPDSRNALWAKSKDAFMYAYRHYLDKAEWFAKFDDDTLVIMPHLREFLAQYSYKDDHYFGRRLYLGGSDDPRLSYYSGGGGYIISRPVLERLGKAVDADPTTFVGPWNAPEDYAFGATVHKLGVDTEDTRDSTGAQRFSALGIRSEISMSREQNAVPWYWSFSKDAREGPACCSKRWITSHYESAESFYAIDDIRKTHCEFDMGLWPFVEMPVDGDEEE